MKKINIILEGISLEIPPLRKDSEGYLRGGFVGIGGNDIALAPNRKCTNDPCDNVHCTNYSCNISVVQMVHVLMMSCQLLPRQSPPVKEKSY